MDAQGLYNGERISIEMHRMSIVNVFFFSDLRPTYDVQPSSHSLQISVSHRSKVLMGQEKHMTIVLDTNSVEFVSGHLKVSHPVGALTAHLCDNVGFMHDNTTTPRLCVLEQGTLILPQVSKQSQITVKCILRGASDDLNQQVD